MLGPLRLQSPFVPRSSYPPYRVSASRRLSTGPTGCVFARVNCAGCSLDDSSEESPCVVTVAVALYEWRAASGGVSRREHNRCGRWDRARLGGVRGRVVGGAHLALDLGGRPVGMPPADLPLYLS